MSPRPKIVHIITGLGPAGAEVMLLELVRQAKHSAFDPYVVGLGHHSGLVPEFEQLGVPVTTLGMKRGVPDPRPIGRLMRVLKTVKPAVVQTWMYHANLIGGLAARAAGSIPVVWGIHHTNLSPAYIKRPTLLIAKASIPLSRRLPRAIVCVAEESRRVHERLGYPDDRMLVIPNGFDTDRFRPDATARESLRAELGTAPDSSLIGMLARFNPQKDHKNFVDTAAILAQSHPGAHFVLCGGGVTWENAELASWIDAAGLRERFHLLGRRTDTPRIDAALDVFMLSSESGEAFPLVIGEAMSCGVPCAVTDVGDSAMIVGDLGAVAPARDPQALAAGIARLLDLSPAERARLSDLCRKRITDHFTLGEVATRYDAVWRRVVEGQPINTHDLDATCV